MKPWNAVDLDGTLAHYATWEGPEHIGAPIPKMVARVRAVLAAGVYDVKVFTARASGAAPDVAAIEAWCLEHLGQQLEVTCSKDFACVALWDDRAQGVLANTGDFVETQYVQELERIDGVLQAHAAAYAATTTGPVTRAGMCSWLLDRSGL